MTVAKKVPVKKTEPDMYAIIYNSSDVVILVYGDRFFNTEKDAVAYFTKDYNQGAFSEVDEIEKYYIVKMVKTLIPVQSKLTFVKS